MHRVLWLLACLSFQALAPARADAQEFAAAIGHTGIYRCHMDTCGFFVIEDAKPVGSARGGTLFVFAAKTWSNEYRARGDNDVHEYDRPPVKTEGPVTFASFVFCSKTRPVEFSFSDGKWTGVALRPGDEDAMAGVVEGAYNFYWAACHDVIVKDPISANLADRLGYRFRGHPAPDDTSVEDEQLQPMDMLR